MEANINDDEQMPTKASNGQFVDRGNWLCFFHQFIQFNVKRSVTAIVLAMEGPSAFLERQWGEWCTIN